MLFGLFASIGIILYLICAIKIWLWIDSKMNEDFKDKFYNFFGDKVFWENWE